MHAHGWGYKYNYNYMGTYMCVIMHTYIAKMTTAGSVPLDIIIIIYYTDDQLYNICHT